MEVLTLGDVLDLREYERIRADYLKEIIERKKLRRVHIGPIISLLFENRDTVKFQIQEMARAEKIITDEGIQAELDAYNTLIPGDGELKATLFIELTSEDELKDWLPKLVGIERSVYISTIQDPSKKVYSKPLVDHEQFLTKEEITPSVHYIAFDLSVYHTEEILNAGLIVGVDHAEYKFNQTLDTLSANNILSDLA